MTRTPTISAKADVARERELKNRWWKSSSCVDLVNPDPATANQISVLVEVI